MFQAARAELMLTAQTVQPVKQTAQAAQQALIVHNATADIMYMVPVVFQVAPAGLMLTVTIAIHVLQTVQLVRMARVQLVPMERIYIKGLVIQAVLI